MIDSRSIDELNNIDAGKPAPPDVATLHHRAFTEFGSRALWNWHELDRPSITQALAIAGSPRSEGDRSARAMAIEIEQACRAAV